MLAGFHALGSVAAARCRCPIRTERFVIVVFLQDWAIARKVVRNRTTSAERINVDAALAAILLDGIGYQWVDSFRVTFRVNVRSWS